MSKIDVETGKNKMSQTSAKNKLPLTIEGKETEFFKSLKARQIDNSPRLRPITI
jgi:hypothetical protein